MDNMMLNGCRGLGQGDSITNLTQNLPGGGAVAEILNVGKQIIGSYQDNVFMARRDAVADLFIKGGIPKEKFNNIFYTKWKLSHADIPARKTTPYNEEYTRMWNAIIDVLTTFKGPQAAAIFKSIIPDPINGTVPGHEKDAMVKVREAVSAALGLGAMPSTSSIATSTLTPSSSDIVTSSLPTGQTPPKTQANIGWILGIGALAIGAAVYMGQPKSSSAKRATTTRKKKT